MKLSKRVVDGLKGPPKDSGKTQILYYDSEIKGFGVRVTPGGKKTFFVRYRSGAKDRRMTIGPYGPITVDEAKNMAKKVIGSALEGADPGAEKTKARKKGPTLMDLAEDYFKNYVSKENSFPTTKKYRSYLDNFIEPVGKTPLPDISRQTIKMILVSSEGDGDQPKRTTSNRVRTMLSKMFSYGIDEGWVEMNPVKSIKPHKLRSREVWAKPNELKALFESIQKESDPFTKGFFQFLLFTTCRKDEARLMKWADVDLQNKIWTIPNTKNDLPHEVALNNGALSILIDMPRMVNPYVFAGTLPGKPINGVGKIWERIRKRAGLEHINIHDLRRTVASYLAQDGVNINHIRQVLNHKDTSITGIYARLDLATKRKTYDRINFLLSEAFLKGHIEFGQHLKGTSDGLA